MNSEIRILFADDFPLDRLGLREAVKQSPVLKLVAEVADGQAALARIRELKPDIAILDINMPMQGGFTVARERPVMGGLAVARVIREQQLPVAVIFLTFHREEAIFHEALSLGAQGYLLKDSAILDIVSCIKAVAGGGHYTSPALTSYLVKRTQRTANPAQQQPDLPHLSPTERHVLKLIAEYKTNKEIAEELGINYRTVETHRSHIRQKYNLEGNHALMKFALSHQSELL